MSKDQSALPISRDFLTR